MPNKARRTVPLPNFAPTEGACKCGCGGQLGDEILTRLQCFIWILEQHAGNGVKCIINSGFRCEKHNASVGGAAESQHLSGCAVDVVFLRANGAQIDNQDVAALARHSGLFSGIGYIEYAKRGKNLVHLDCRPGSLVQW